MGVMRDIMLEELATECCDDDCCGCNDCCHDDNNDVDEEEWLVCEAEETAEERMRGVNE